MPLDRRSFVVAAASMAASAAVRPHSSLGFPANIDGGSDDPLGVRADFPIVTGRTYLNSAYITPIPRQVVAAGQAFVEAKAVRPLLVADLLSKNDEVRTQFARLVNASPEEIGLLFSTGEGENVIANGLDLAPGDNVVVDELHYPTEFVLYRALEVSRGIELRIVKHRDGAVDASDFEPYVDRRTKIVSVAWVSNQNGFRHEMRPIADLAHAHGALFYADAIQAVGMFPVDVRAAGVDFLCCGSYKWMLAGFGVAPFFIRRELLDRVRLDRFGEMQIVRELPAHHFDLEQTAKRFDYGTRAFGEVYQLGAGLAYLDKVGVARIEAHAVGLAQRLHEGLVRQGHRMFTPAGNRSSIVTFLSTKTIADLHAAFQAANVDVKLRDGTARGPDAMDRGAGAGGARVCHVRIATALFNTADEVDRCLEVTRRLV